jgi:hypothetical protein
MKPLQHYLFVNHHVETLAKNHFCTREKAGHPNLSSLILAKAEAAPDAIMLSLLRPI